MIYEKVSLYFNGVIFIFSLAACTGVSENEYDMETQQSETEPGAEVEQEVDNKENEDIIPEVSEEPAVVYAEEDVVNRFISEFNGKTKYKMTDISKGNIRTKFSLMQMIAI